MKLGEIVSYLNEILRTNEISDDSKNGLQVENNGEVKKIGIAVDACVESFKEAKRRKVDFLIVHHGLLWKEINPVTGNFYKRLKILIEGNIALYAAHLPLDMHSKFGNNSVGVKLLGFEKGEKFGNYHGIEIGYEFRIFPPEERRDIKSLIGEKLKTKVISWDFGKKIIERGAFVSGFGLSLLPEAIEKELDIFITGEPSHIWFWKAKEGKINVFFAGHYKTEILGVRTLGKHLSEKFNLPLEILDFPTGL